MPIDWSSLCNRMSWSMVSNAALRSNKTLKYRHESLVVDAVVGVLAVAELMTDTADKTSVSSSPGAGYSCVDTPEPYAWEPEGCNAFPVCNQHKPSNQVCAVFLQPLSVPCLPMCPISLDFVTGLPLSNKQTTILTVVDRFSKMAHFVLLPKFSSAKETAELVLLLVFRLQDLPMDVVSDRGPQFTSVFWIKLCTLIGATASLSSGFHAQSNSQTQRKNQEIETAPRCLVLKQTSSWSQQLLWVKYAHNTLTSCANRKTFWTAIKLTIQNPQKM